jgi:hypothetical protein
LCIVLTGPTLKELCSGLDGGFAGVVERKGLAERRLQTLQAFAGSDFKELGRL